MWHAINESLSDFCSSVLWDTDLTWNSADPHFTQCFERTILTWLPCAFLWVSLPMSVCSFRYSTSTAIPFNRYNVCKLVIIAVLVLFNLVDIGNYVFFGRGQVLIYVHTLLIRFFTTCVFFGLTYTSIKCGVVSSGTLFLFSVLLVLCGTPQFRTELRSRGNIFKSGSEAESREIVRFLSYFVHYLASLVCLCLSCFADTCPDAKATAHVCPENYSSVLSRAFFSWFDSFAWKGYHCTLDPVEDVWNIEGRLKTAHVSSRFESKLHLAFRRARRNAKVSHESEKLLGYGNDQRSTSGATHPSQYVSIFLPLVQTFGGYIMFGSLTKLFQSFLSFVSPLILNRILDFVANKTEVTWHGYLYASALLLVSLLQSILQNVHGRTIFRNGLMIRTALVSAIYKKALKISNGAQKNFTVGEIVNLISVDAERFYRVMFYLTFVWCTPIVICLSLVYLWNILGWSVLAGVMVLVVFMPVNYALGSRIQKLQIQQMKLKDKRVKLTSELLSGIKVLKLNAWEPSFERQITSIRKREIAILKKTSYLESCSSFVWTLAPFLLSLVTFATFVLFSGKTLTAQIAFVSLSLFNILRFPLSMLPSVITNMTQMAVSIKRISKFLSSEDLDPDAVRHEARPEPVIIENGHFSWEGYDGSPVLSNINLKVKKGSLVAVVGPVGVGKSSLLSAILGEMYKQSGFVNTTGTLAYVPQQAWIQNATFKENITFGEAPNDSLYADVLIACALTADLKILPGQDRAEIGEKGVNLSGGQKQRISLARAVYSDADTYLLDDPLSAVDSHVGKHIFEHVIGPNGLLKEKTRVWVTHNLAYLSQVDFIVVLQNGMISESGTYQELMEMKGDFAKNLANTYLNESTSKDEEGDAEVTVPDNVEELGSSERKSVGKVAGQKLIQDEKGATGTVNWSVYLYYLNAVGLISVTLILFMNILYQLCSMGSNYWLSIWSSDTSNSTDKQFLYMGVYALLGFSEAFSILVQSLVLFAGMFEAANYIHNRLLISVLHWPAITFDTMPLGRIINRFGSDMDILDNVLPSTLAQALLFTATISSTMLIISYSIPMFVNVILPIGAFYYFIQRFYIVTSRQLKRFQSISKSPIYSHMGETVTGVQSIRAYGVQSKFIRMLENKVDFNLNSSYASVIADRWLAVRLEMVGGIITFFSAIFAVFARDTLSAGLVGLAVSYAMQITLKFFPWLRTMSEVETNVVAVERIKEYEEEEQEAPWQVQDENTPADWPGRGEVVFEDYEVRYREGSEPVLKGISFSVASGEKVGIVGRTGAGKSSLTLSLFRIIEPSGGRILIDGVDITQIGLHTLRGRLTIIPQDPVLFSGTLQINLDPAGVYSNEELWRALELANLKTFVSSLAFGLQSEVAEGGNNFSVGQRQLICLARAVLQKTKLLILDEATAAVDMETDDFIQSTIRKEFKDSTVLTIAHRLNTVLDYDRILVLDNGRIAEFDSPGALLESKQSIFYKMVSDAGLV